MIQLIDTTKDGGEGREPHERLKHIGAKPCVMDAAPSLFPVFNSVNLHSGFGFWACFVRSLCRIHRVLRLWSTITPTSPRFQPASPLIGSSPSPRMQNMQRRFGRMTTKESADDSQIAVLLKDFDDADMLLGKVGIHIS